MDLSWLRPPEWAERAACTDSATRWDDPWHPDDDAPPSVRRRAFAQARRVCLSCPVQVECARHGVVTLERAEVTGMFGGLEPAELRTLARRLGRSSRKVAQHGTRARYVAGCTDGPDGRACDRCRRANATWEHERRLRRAA